MIVADSVSMRHGLQYVLRDVSVTLAPGEVLAIVGPNGAGKSTLLAILSGEIRPTSGQCTLAGKEMGRWRPAELARRRAMLTQRSELAFDFTVREVVALGRVPFRATHTDEAVETALADVEMEHTAERTYLTLSGGERQRVHLARVLAQMSGDGPEATPSTCLLDEPTAALDPRHQHLALQSARRLAAGRAAVAIALHDLTLAATYADQVLLLAAGTTIAAGSPNHVLQPGLLEAAYGVPFDRIEREGGRPVLIARPPVRR